VPAMISVLKDRAKSRQHRDALTALSGCGPAAKSALPVLTLALKGENSSEAARALGTIGPCARNALPALREVLRGGEPCDRAALILAVLKIDPAAVGDIDGLLESVQDFHGRAAVLGYLGRTCPEGVGLARLYLKSLVELLQSERAYNPDGVQPIEYTLSRLGELGPSAAGAISTISGLLNHRDVVVRSAARRALCQIERTALPQTSPD
jgi:hypothetical protein